MKKKQKPTNAEFKIKIGEKVRKMRKDNTDLNYIDFAKAVGLNKNTVFKIEKGTVGDYYITSLKCIIDYYPEMTMEMFFRELEK